MLMPANTFSLSKPILSSRYISTRLIIGCRRSYTRLKLSITERSSERLTRISTCVVKSTWWRNRLGSGWKQIAAANFMNSNGVTRKKNARLRRFWRWQTSLLRISRHASAQSSVKKINLTKSDRVLSKQGNLWLTTTCVNTTMRI